jgi:HlyD family secretion protein
MKPNLQIVRIKTRKIWILILVVLCIAAGGAGYYYWSQKNASTASTTDSYKTTQVKRGSITLSTSGSGTLSASQESSLSFPIDGKVAKLTVQVGDQVKEGQVLAELDQITQLQTSVNSAQQDLITAQKTLKTLKNNATANIANAQLAVSTAQKAVVDAKSGVVQKGMARCDQNTIDAYYYKWTKAQDSLAALGDGGNSQDYYLKVIVPAKNAVASAYATYVYCAGFTDYEISSSQATLSLDQATLQQAQETLDTLTQNNGVDPTELANAEAEVTSAQLALDQAKEKLDRGTMKAPFDGTILSIGASLGDTIDSTSTFITIADLNHPQMEFNVDETDMEKIAVGEEATITFDAIPNKTFKGKIVRIYPTLATSGGYKVVQGLIELDVSQESSGTMTSLRKGLTATVSLIQATAENVLLVPTQAVRDLGDGTYGVFVVGADGQPKLKVVEVGLQDAASAEIKSGLNVGDVVTTGTVQTK